MAVFAFGGGNSGIKEYFEDGKKQGRTLSRDQIDQRIVLEGDLDICDSIIHSRDSEHERYDHITLSFKEKDISIEVLQAITADFKNFINQAFGEDEIYLYAEAHMPKMATEQKWNSKTKLYETVARYPHIHFVIPKSNLVTGKRESVFEMLTAKYASKDKTMDVIDAFQESINQKYGLASPKDNRRTEFTSEADIISRIKEDVFTGRNQNILAMVRDQMMAQKIESPQAFMAMLKTMGEVSEGKGGEYLQLKLPGEKQNVRLKDYQFSSEFVSKPMQEKVDFYARRSNQQSPEQIQAAKTRRDLLLQKWRDRAREIKYLTPSSKFYLQHYVKATDKQKTYLLDRIEVAHFVELESTFGYVNPKKNEAAIERLAGPQVLAQSQIDALVKYMNVFQVEQAAHHTHIEDFTSARLNATYLRTTDQLLEANAAGEQIMAAPGEVIDTLTFNQSHFSEATLERHLLKNTDGHAQYEAAMKAVLACPALVIHSNNERGMQFTSSAIVAIEKRLTERAERMARAPVKAVSAAQQQAVIDAKPFNQGQREAFKLLCSGKQLVVVNGAAGTGKSFVLAAMRQAYQKEGFTVYGAILQGKTAEDLERDSGIQSRTIARMLIDLQKGNLTLDAQSVLVVDEAGMVGSRDLEKLMAYTEAAGARLRLVGDARQLAAVEYGNAFVEVSERAEVASLSEIMRQKTQWQRQASQKFAVHDIEGLQDYAEQGCVHLEDTEKDAQIALVRAWSTHRIMNPAQSRIVLVHTNASRIELNELMRAELKKQRQLKSEIDVTTSRGTLPMAVGEKVMFTKADRDLDVKNGSTGTVSKISAEGTVTIILEGGGRTTEFRAQQEADKGVHIDYGYAVTVHKSQGMTVDAAFVLADKSMTKENLGVAMTRHRHEASIYASAEQFATLPEMVKALDRTGQKAFTAGREWTSEHRQEDSMMGQYVANMNAAKVIERAAQTAQYQEIVAHLEAGRVLDHVSKSHGLDTSRCTIVTNGAGKQRIQVGDQVMDAAAFLTQAMHLDYRMEAAPILKQCYAEQLAKAYSQPRREPGQVIDQTLQREFAEHLKARDAQFKAARQAIDEHKRQAKAVIGESEAPEAVKAERQAALTRQITSDKKELIAAHDKPNADLYKDFLAAQAPQSARHLDELARVSLTRADKARLAAIQMAQGITPGLSHLTPQQLHKGISHVLSRTPDQGRPPAHILARNRREAGARARFADDLARAQERPAAPQTDPASGVHELPAGRVDAAGPHRGMLLPGALHDGLGHLPAGQHHNVRRAGAGKTSRVELVDAIKPAAPVLTLASEQAGAEAAQGVQEAMARVKEAAAQAAQAEAHRLEQEEKTQAGQDAQAEIAEAQKVVGAENAAEEYRLSEPAQLADIHQQIDAARAAADQHSVMARLKTPEAYHDIPASGVVVASNEVFVAVRWQDKVRLYKTAELTEKLEYDGIDTGHGRFAPGNQIESKDGEGGMRTFLSEEREAMQNEEKKQRERGKKLGR
ncbi:AAA family ATPase [Polaromonas hydrogenivorans]|uniref:AAA family ATPase n=1 Tax=Polaromonas hydrogenivorans TaxID=335476 RepID=A0AAU7M098_9BURK